MGYKREGVRSLYLPRDRETENLIREVEDWQRAKDKPFNQAVLEGLKLLVDRDRKIVQAKLLDYMVGSGLGPQIEHLHRRFRHPNPERHRSWYDCLAANNLLVEEAIEYCKARGWWSDADAETLRLFQRKVPVRR